MAGTLTLGGMADGLLIGQVIVGPASMNGKQAISEIINVTLEANTDFVVKVPSEAVAFGIIFTFTGSPGELKLGSNLSATATGFVVPASGWMALPLSPGTTELKFKSPEALSTFQLVFV